MWRTCPKCKKTLTKKRADEIKSLRESYGKISIDLYNEELMALSNKKEIISDETLQEDYRQYMNEDGLLAISYSCFCETCGFKYHFDKKIQTI